MKSENDNVKKRPDKKIRTTRNCVTNHKENSKNVNSISISDLRDERTEILKKVIDGESFFIQKHGKTIAIIKPHETNLGPISADELLKLNLMENYSLEELRDFILLVENSWMSELTLRQIRTLGRISAKVARFIEEYSVSDFVKILDLLNGKTRLRDLL